MPKNQENMREALSVHEEPDEPGVWEWLDQIKQAMMAHHLELQQKVTEFLKADQESKPETWRDRAIREPML